MDALQFGRWVSEHRRRYGWRSQRALVEAAHRERYLLSECSISEDFLARLEAGQLMLPFRGRIRQRVLALGELLCKTPRELNSYLHAARLTKLSSDEADYVNRLKERLAAGRCEPVLLLPPRPAHFFGRTPLLRDLLSNLASTESGLYALTGMTGVGKSALASEVVHQLVANERECQHLFPGGIATFTCTGRRGVDGLIALLNEVTEVFSAVSKSSSKAARMTRTLPVSSGDDLATVIGRTRVAMANRSVLLLLDDVDVQFPLRQAMDALLAHELRGEQIFRIVLTTSRYVPSPALMTHHLPIVPLEPGAAFELFVALVGRGLCGEERAYAEHICAAVGYLPLAIEVAANAVAVNGVTLSLLAACVTERPLDVLLDSENELGSRLAQALEAFQPELQKRFALLATLGKRPFGLESAAAIHVLPDQDKESELDTESPTSSYMGGHSLPISGNCIYQDTPPFSLDEPLTPFASTAAELGQFVRHSLVELAPPASSGGSGSTRHNYRLHPLLYAHAMERLEQLEPKIACSAQHNMQAYALAYLERYQGDVPQLERERELLLDVLQHAWQREQYALVVRFVAGILPLVGRLGNYKEALRLLRQGIYACEQIKDHYHLALFLYRLGGILCSHGHLGRAQQVLKESLAIAEVLKRPACLWRPLARLAYLAFIKGEHEVVRYLTGTYLKCCQEEGDPGSVSSALHVDGFFARVAGDRDRAYDDISLCLQLILSRDLHSISNECSVFEMTVRAEFARVQDDYARSQAYTEAALALGQRYHDPYFIADLLLNQADFAYEQGEFDDAHMLAQRVVEVTAKVEASHYHERAIELLKRLPGIESLLPRESPFVRA